MKYIDPHRYNLTVEEFEEWAASEGITVIAKKQNRGVFYSTREFHFPNEEDLTVFRLKFPLAEYTGNAGFFYCPYIPVQNVTLSTVVLKTRYDNNSEV